jgi:N-acetylglucosaminyldiphosphoundecaprenol N-acetyl-beta-D-mannosaminyltransferase
VNDVSLEEMVCPVDIPAGHHRPLETSRIFVGHVGIDTYSESSLVHRILHHALHGGATHQIVTVNAQIYVLAQKWDRYRKCLDSAEYVCADGMPLAWACNHLGGVKVPRVAGVDLIERLCEGGAADGLSVFLLGGRPNSAELAARKLSQRYPGLRIAGVSCPDWGFETSADTLRPVIDQIAKAKPHILFAALGAPKQELLIEDYIRPLNVPIPVGVGGSFEILSGFIDRAPMWMQSSGLEWAFRLSKDPKRLWRRYLIGNAEFLWSVLKWKLQMFSTDRESLPEQAAPGRRNSGMIATDPSVEYGFIPKS